MRYKEGGGGRGDYQDDIDIVFKVNITRKLPWPVD